MAKNTEKKPEGNKPTKAKNSAKNVSRKITNAIRAEQKHGRRYDFALMEEQRRALVDSKGKADAKNKLSQLRNCEAVFADWEGKGVLWSQIVQAIKTDKLAERQGIWSDRWGQLQLARGSAT